MAEPLRPVEGRIADDGQSVVFPHPELEGVMVDVQHSVKSGKPFSPEKGMLGAGVVILPTGQPRVLVQMRHADGESMGAGMTGQDCFAFIECFLDAMKQAEEIAAQADAAKGRAS